MAQHNGSACAGDGDDPHRNQFHTELCEKYGAEMVRVAESRVPQQLQSKVSPAGVVQTVFLEAIALKFDQTPPQMGLGEWLFMRLESHLREKIQRVMHSENQPHDGVRNQFYADLCRTYQEEMERFAEWRLPRPYQSSVDAKGVVQEVLWEEASKAKLDQTPPPMGLRNFLFIRLRDRLIDAIRSDKVRRPRQGDLEQLGPVHPAAPQPTPGTDAVQKEGMALARKVLEETLPQLSEPYQEILRLKFIQDLPYERIAKELGITKGNARLRVLRARGALYKILRNYPDLLQVLGLEVKPS
jgi:RNA polymerase sigma factor (sigma-70 family)